MQQSTGIPEVSKAALERVGLIEDLDLLLDFELVWAEFVQGKQKERERKQKAKKKSRPRRR